MTSRVGAELVIRSFDPDPQSAEPAALVLHLDDLDPADHRRRRDVRAAVGLRVQADDVDDPHHLDVRRQQIGGRPDDVRDRERLVPRQDRTSIRRSAAISALHASATRSLKSAGTSARSKSIRAVSGSMLPPVTSAPKSRKTTPVSTCSPEWVRISAVRRSSSSAPRTAVPGGRNRVALGRDQVELVALAGADDAGAHAAPEQHALVRRLPTAAGIERRPVQHDPAVLGPRPARSRPTPGPSRRRGRAGGCVSRRQSHRHHGLPREIPHEPGLSESRRPASQLVTFVATHIWPVGGQVWATLQMGRIVV